MHILHGILLIGLLGGAVGCRTPDFNPKVYHQWGCEDAREFKARLDDYKHVFLVCIYEDHWEDRGPNRYSLHHYSGTVVTVYKGDWRVSERVSFVQRSDSRAPLILRTQQGALGSFLPVSTQALRSVSAQESSPDTMRIMRRPWIVYSTKEQTMNSVFIVQHLNVLPSGQEDVKFIGASRSFVAARSMSNVSKTSQDFVTIHAFSIL